MKVNRNYRIFLFKTPARLRGENDEEYAYRVLNIIADKLNLGQIEEYQIKNKFHYKQINAVTKKGFILVKYKESKEAIAIIKIRNKARTRYYFR